MNTYTVQPGDTLIGIAKEQLGQEGLWREIAERNNITDPSKLRVGQKLNLPERQSQPAADNRAVTPAATHQVRIALEGNIYMAILDDTEEEFRVGKKYRKGISRIGNQKPERFVEANKDMLSNLKLSESEQNVIFATAENEGCMDAINSWDAHFLSFGMFQWTSGGSGNAGELPKLLQLIQDQGPDSFEKYFRQFGLGTENVGRVTGWLTLNGRRLESSADKDQLRDPIWAYRFARAGMDASVKSVQILHCINRLDRFYFSQSSKLGNHSLSQLITSEYGLALLLDNHVNRPAWVVPCVAQAMQELNLSPEQVANGDEATESSVIDRYLQVRATYKSSSTSAMTDAEKRAGVTQKYLNRELISAGKHSFVSNRNERVS